MISVSLLFTLGFVSGCAVSTQNRIAESSKEIKSGDIRVTPEQVRLRMRSLVGPMCGQVEECADEIMASTNDIDVKLAALEWEIDAVPALREALFRPDPDTAVFDTAVLCYQMVDYFQTGDGKQALGPASAQAAATSQRMADDLMRVIASGTYSGDISRGREVARQWATQHPIHHSIADRESALSRVFEQQFAGGLSISEQVVAVGTSVDDLNRKLDIYTAQLFRQARWEVEQLKLELIKDLQGQDAIPLARSALKSAQEAATTVDRLAPEIEHTLNVAQDAPRIVDSERATAVGAIQDEMTRTIRAIHSERIAALNDMRATIDQQRKQMADEADAIATRKIDYAIRRVTWLVAWVMMVAIVGALAGLLLLRRMFPGSAPQHRGTNISRVIISPPESNR